MRVTFACTVVLATGCFSTASQTQFEALAQVSVKPPFPPLQNPDVVKRLPGEAPVACTPRDGGTRFVDMTDAWNLGSTGLKLVGNRLTVADLDSDGYPDLVVHAVTSNLRQPIELPDGGKRLVWQLMNRPTSAGYRTFVDETGNGLFDVFGGSPTHYRSAQLAVFGDVDNDGDLDAFSGTYTDPTKPNTDPGDRSEILLNDGTGHFTIAQESATTPLPSERLPTTSAAFTDADRDGRLDVFVGNWYESYGYSYLGVQARLYRGQGGGQFSDVTQQSNLSTDDMGFEQFTQHRPAYGVTACDVDDDGAPELMVSAYGRQPNLLYRNDGAGRFVDQSVASGFASDSNVDYRDNENFRCWCTANRADPKCAGVANPSIGCPNPNQSWGVGTDDAAWRNGGNTFTTWCGDVDGDGKNELYNAEIHHWWAGGASDSSELLKNVSTPGMARFTRPGNGPMGLAFPHPSSDWNEGGLMAAGGDLDNDGRLDLVVAASDYADQFGLVFQQKADGTFIDQGLAWGLRHECMSGLAIADFDRDGDLDVLAGASTARDCARRWSKNEVRLYENQASDTNWMLLHLEGDGTTANRSAIGAKVTVKAGGRTATREVSGGYGHFGMQNDLTVHVGLGGCEGADEVTVRWPDAQGTTQQFTRVPGNQFMRLKQGAAEPFQVK